MAARTVTLKLPRQAWAPLRAHFDEAGFEFRRVDHAEWQARGDCIATLYSSGKLVLQGASIDAWELLAEELGASATKRTGPAADAREPADVVPGAAPVTRFADAIARLPRPRPTAWIGIDEAGKGDYFGPLVVAAARVHVDQLPLLAELGVGDSKGLSDKKVLALARELQHVVPNKRLVLMPPRYNELYGRIRNLNKLLAWAHAACAENLLETGVEAELILSDQFASTDLITPRLKERAKALRFVQRTRAEEDPAVACASIFARAEFLRRLDVLSKEVGVTLAKGAGPPVLAAGREYVGRLGAAALGDVAKLHFKTTQSLT